jgi:hypothetical protein
MDETSGRKKASAASWWKVVKSDSSVWHLEPYEEKTESGRD